MIVELRNYCIENLFSFFLPLVILSERAEGKLVLHS